MLKQQYSNIKTVINKAIEAVKVKYKKGILLIQAEFILVKEKVKQSIKNIKAYFKSWVK